MVAQTVRRTKRFFKVVGGFGLLLAGGIMLFTPGPGLLTIALGLAMLATEFVWARRSLDRMKASGMRLRAAFFPSSDSKTT